jgi:hypothetical protein
MSVELKIKAKHLAFEPGIIRKEEQKLKKAIRAHYANIQINPGSNTAPPTEKERLRESLYRHRVWDVRNESRATHLTRAFIAGKPYRSVESKSDMNFVQAYMLSRMSSMIAKYDPRYKNKLPRKPKPMEYGFAEKDAVYRKALSNVRKDILEWMNA